MIGTCAPATTRDALTRGTSEAALRAVERIGRIGGEGSGGRQGDWGHSGGHKLHRTAPNKKRKMPSESPR